MGARSLLGRMLLCGSACWPFPAPRAEAAAGRSAEPVLRAGMPPLAEPLAAREDVSQALTPLAAEEGSSQVPALDFVANAPLQGLPVARTALEVAAGAPTSPPASFAVSAARPNPDAGAQEQHILSKAGDEKLGIPAQRKAADEIREEQSSGRDPAAGRGVSMALFDYMVLYPPGASSALSASLAAEDEPLEAGPERRVPMSLLKDELHDVRTPFAHTIGFLDLLIDRAHPSRVGSDGENNHLLFHARDEVSAALAAINSFITAAGGAALQVPLADVLALAEALGGYAAWGTRLLEEAPAPGDATGEKWLRTIKEGFAKASDRIGAMAWTMLRMGQIRVSWERARPGSVLESAFRYWQPAAALKGVELELEADPGLPEVQFDRGLSLRVLDNLVGNAVKFTALEAARRSGSGDGYSGRVVVRARRGSGADDQDYVVIAVSDNGPGIAEEDQARIFEAGYQSGPRAHRDAGTGLGLGIARRYAQAQNGDVRVVSEPGRGSTFSFRLRVAGP